MAIEHEARRLHHVVANPVPGHPRDFIFRHGRDFIEKHHRPQVIHGWLIVWRIERAQTIARLPRLFPFPEWINNPGGAVGTLVSKIFGVDDSCAETMGSGDDRSVPIGDAMFTFQRDRFENQLGIDRDDGKTEETRDELESVRLGKGHGNFLRCGNVKLAQHLRGGAKVHRPSNARALSRLSLSAECDDTE